MPGVGEILEQLRTQQAVVQERLAGVTEEQMVVKVAYGQREVDIRFMFYRLIAHEVEHTVHLAKTLQALGRSQGEAQLILSRFQTLRGELEGLLVGLPAEELDRAPGEEWSPRRVLEHIMETQEMYSKRIADALAAAPAAR
jgi:hypothetical protein